MMSVAEFVENSDSLRNLIYPPETWLAVMETVIAGEMFIDELGHLFGMCAVIAGGDYRLADDCDEVLNRFHRGGWDAADYEFMRELGHRADIEDANHQEEA